MRRGQGGEINWKRGDVMGRGHNEWVLHLCGLTYRLVSSAPHCRRTGDSACPTSQHPSMQDPTNL